MKEAEPRVPNKENLETHEAGIEPITSSSSRVCLSFYTTRIEVKKEVALESF